MVTRAGTAPALTTASLLGSEQAMLESADVARAAACDVGMEVRIGEWNLGICGTSRGVRCRHYLPRFWV